MPAFTELPRHCSGFVRRVDSSSVPPTLARPTGGFSQSCWSGASFLEAKRGRAISNLLDRRGWTTLRLGRHFTRASPGFCDTCYAAAREQ